MNEMTFTQRYSKIALIASFIVIFDQITKFVIMITMPMMHSIPVIPGFFNITHIHNQGGAFGIFADQNLMVRRILFLFISSLAAAVVLYFYRKTPKSHALLATGYSMIFGGAIGNLIDRIRFGKVIDFLDFYIGMWHWPAFNVADSTISIGVGIFIFHVIFNKIPEY